MNTGNGSRIELDAFSHNWRDYLAFECSDRTIRMRAVHAGDSLELWHDGAWLPVHYETSHGQVGWLFHNDEHAYKLERLTIRLRWRR